MRKGELTCGAEAYIQVYVAWCSRPIVYDRRPGR